MSKGFVGAVLHAEGYLFSSAQIAGLVDAPLHPARTRIAGYLNTAPFRPETSRVVKRADELADLASIAQPFVSDNPTHVLVSLDSDTVLVKILRGCSCCLPYLF